MPKNNLWLLNLVVVAACASFAGSAAAHFMMVSTSPRTIRRAVVADALRDPSVVASSARFARSPGGFAVFALRPGSVLASLGLQNGDTLLALNGISITTPDQLLEAYTRLRSATHLSLRIDRHGVPLTLDYVIR